MFLLKLLEFCVIRVAAYFEEVSEIYTILSCLAEMSLTLLILERRAQTSYQQLPIPGVVSTVFSNWTPILCDTSLIYFSKFAILNFGIADFAILLICRIFFLISFYSIFFLLIFRCFFRFFNLFRFIWLSWFGGLLLDLSDHFLYHLPPLQFWVFL